MSRSLLKLLVLTALVATLTALGVSLAFADGEPRASLGADPVATLPPVVFLSSSAARGNVNGLKFSDEDIIVFFPENETGTVGTWSMFFDGSDVGLANADINGFELLDDTTVLMTFDRPLRIPGLGRIDDSDILKFTFSAVPGLNTAGTFELCFDGSNYDLTTGAEDIDAIAFDPEGRLLISTDGTARVNGRALRAYDEDLLVFGDAPFVCNPPAAPDSWDIYVDGSDIQLKNGSEDVNAAWVDSSVADKNIYLATKGRFRVASGGGVAAGDNDDIFGMTPFTLGENQTTGFPFAAFDGDIVGQRKAIDGIYIAPVSALTAASLQAAALAVDDEEETVAQFFVEEDDLTEEDLVDPELDMYDSTEDLLDEDDVVITIYVPMVQQ
ncbi:MAG: hypothetical protein KDE53_08475 [Caldilineaceae bacterium]|nr:hypothetical protein [Caldilineaceae bacterium]MCB0126218.1 hypothetical protein [Caldilineaceae bacterium]